ncbi:MAG: hypothetical protein PHC99_10875, partial [Methylococcales bacterium]|nr:hypothetical protein [Methylococcales bacterium]
MLPVSEPVGWNKKSKARLANLLAKAKDLVQSLNDNFNLYSTVSIPTPAPAPVFAQPAPIAQPQVVAPQPVVQIQPAPAIEIPVAPAQPTSTQQPQQSALMKKFARK